MRQELNADIKVLLRELEEIESIGKLLEKNKLELYFRKGKVLNHLKGLLPHGEFLSFLKSSNIKINPRHAQRIMELAANEDLIRANTTDLSYLTLDKAFAMIKKKLKSEETTPQIVGQFKISTAFHAGLQIYQVKIEINAEDKHLMRCKKNQRNVTVSVRKTLENFFQSFHIADLTTVSLN